MEVGRGAEITGACILILAALAGIAGSVPALIGAGALSVFLLARYAYMSLVFGQVAGSLVVERDVGKRIARSTTDIDVDLEIRATIPPGIRALIRDIPPEGGEVIEGDPAVWLNGPLDDAYHLHYRMNVPVTGSVRFGGVSLSVADPFFPCSGTLSAESMRLPSVLMKPNRFFLSSRGGGMHNGAEDRRRISGTTGVVRSIREYVEGDAVRNIDWKISAKYGSLYVREYAAEDQEPPLLVLDVPQVMVTDSDRSALTGAVMSAIATWMQETGNVSLMIVRGAGVIAFHPREPDYGAILASISASWSARQDTWFYRSRPFTSIRRDIAALNSRGGAGANGGDGAREYVASLASVYGAVLEERPVTVFERQVSEAVSKVRPGKISIFSCFAGDLSHLALVADIAARFDVGVDIWTEKDQDRQQILKRAGISGGLVEVKAA
ncbi:DUF58 domain-containing protein [Methanofollis fontis]|uniref:DUF58 domain-containing protein n=1 Tax=Methanofollis fontis TaxID=2052832 RepID=A0A483CRI5_9EURY|nr:DUF58 domain-containing protein [Methanofollis fontis]TAJ43931.1 hypothetical protein CUJ86_07695 [Methanofollis fontis]